MARLVVYLRGRRVHDGPVGPGARLGRAPESDVRLDDPLVNWNHAAILVAGGTWVVQDLGTLNGVWVEGHREFRAPLHDGTEFAIGPFLARFALRPGELVPRDGVPADLEVPAHPAPSGARALLAHDEHDTRPADVRTLARLRAEAKAMIGPHLVEVRPEHAVFALTQPACVLGAGATAHVHVAAIGRPEAVLIAHSGNGTYVARKLGWRTHLRVDHAPVSEAALHDGSLLETGDAAFEFRLGAR